MFYYISLNSKHWNDSIILVQFSIVLHMLVILNSDTFTNASLPFILLINENKNRKLFPFICKFDN